MLGVGLLTFLDSLRFRPSTPNVETLSDDRVYLAPRAVARWDIARHIPTAPPGILARNREIEVCSPARRICRLPRSRTQRPAHLSRSGTARRTGIFDSRRVDPPRSVFDHHA